MPRKPLHDQPMTAAERQAAFRRKKDAVPRLAAAVQKAERMGLDIPDPYTPAQKKEALALIAMIRELESRAQALGAALAASVEDRPLDDPSTEILKAALVGGGVRLTLPVF